MERFELVNIAKETLKAIDDGYYTSSSGKTVNIKESVEHCVKNSVLYNPNSLKKELSTQYLPDSRFKKPIIEITNETTTACALRLKDEEPCVLNFASALYVGGAFLQGSRAQEESICRVSGLYPALLNQPEYYNENNKSENRNGYYLDYAIYSPEVPVFRSDSFDWLDVPYKMSVVTSPAPAKRFLFDSFPTNEWEDIDDKVEEVVRNRIDQILKIIANHGHRTIILGAFGCGAFGNDPYMIADVFKDMLEVNGYFYKVVFAIYGNGDNLQAFEEVFTK